MRTFATLFAILTCATAQTVDVPAVTQYKLYDVGTSGVNYTFFNLDLTGGDFSPRPFNNHGQVAGIAYNSAGKAGSYYWGNGHLLPLPSEPEANVGGGGSNALGINDAGLIIGISNNGEASPVNGQLYTHAVAWVNGKLKPLGDLGGHDSDTSFVNDFGLIAGYAYNATPDNYSFFGTQVRATLWGAAGIQDLGTLGGTDSQAWAINNRGQVIGISFLNTPPVPPFGQPQDDAFLWTDGVMTDLGTLGGGFSTPTAINLSGQVTVLAFDSSNQYYQSFLWSAGKRTLLNSVGGHYLEAVTLNDAGVSAGAGSDPTDSTAIATRWSPSGAVTSLGVIAGDSGSVALGVNRNGVIVGGSGTVNFSSFASYAHAFVWQGNGTIQDLNTLIPAGSTLTLNVAYAINGDGLIAGLGTNSAGDTHTFVLVPQTSSLTTGFRSAATAPAAPGSTVRLPRGLGGRTCKGLCR